MSRSGRLDAPASRPPPERPAAQCRPVAVPQAAQHGLGHLVGLRLGRVGGMSDGQCVAAARTGGLLGDVRQLVRE